MLILLLKNLQFKYTMHLTQSFLLIQKSDGGDKELSHFFSVSKQLSYESWPAASCVMYQLWNHSLESD